MACPTCRGHSQLRSDRKSTTIRPHEHRQVGVLRLLVAERGAKKGVSRVVSSRDCVCSVLSHLASGGLGRMGSKHLFVISSTLRTSALRSNPNLSQIHIRHARCHPCECMTVHRNAVTLTLTAYRHCHRLTAAVTPVANDRPSNILSFRPCPSSSSPHWRRGASSASAHGPA